METPTVPVYFTCHGCGRLYQARQQRRTGTDQFDCTGHFDCTDCGAAVHQWSHHYDFTEWRKL